MTPATAGPPASLAPSPPVSSATPSAGPPPASPGTPRRPNRAPLYAAVVAVVVVVLLVSLIVTGALPIFAGSSTGNGGVLTYSQAAPIAARSASGYQGGGWAPLVAAGLDAASPEVIPINSSSFSTVKCNLSLAAGVSSTVSVPAYSGNRTAGLAPVWEFLYRNATGAALIVLVLDGTATVIGTLSGTDCTAVFELLSVIPSSVKDSSEAGAAVASNAATFLAQYPNANVSFGLVGGVSFLGQTIGPEWGVEMTSCSIAPAAAGTGTEFNATVSATSGAVIYSQTRTSVPCGASSTLTFMPIVKAFLLGPETVMASAPSTPT